MIKIETYLGQTLQPSEKSIKKSKDKYVKYASTLSTLQGVFETNKVDMFVGWGKDELAMVLDESIARTCLNILVSLVNQDMNIISQNPKVEKVISDFNRKAKMKSKMDSIVYNQLGFGTGIIFHDVTRNKVMVYDNQTVDIIHDSLQDEFVGLWQQAKYLDPDDMKKGIMNWKWNREFIPSDNLILIPGIGQVYGESLGKPAIPYVRAKHELLNNLPELVERLGLLTVVGVDIPGDISNDSVDEYLEEIRQLILQAAANTTWILPKETTVEGVRGSGEARIIESVKVVIDMLDEEIRKCFFVPDTFLTSLSANRATAKEQRYLIASMIQHVRDLIEESLRDLYDEVLAHNLITGYEYEFSWGNINMPEPEALFLFLQTCIDSDVLDLDEIRKYLNQGTAPPKLRKLWDAKQKQALAGTKVGIQSQNDIYNQMKGGKKPSQMMGDNKSVGGVDGKGVTGAVQPK